jgi:rare lipoprotein A
MRRWLSVGAIALLSACSSAPSSRTATGYYPVAPPTAAPDTTPAATPAAADTGVIPDAVPRAEERSRSGNPAFYVVAGQRYVVLQSSTGFVERGVASWYGPGFHGVNTAMGEPYNMYAMSAAHRTLPIPCYARVTNLGNNRSVVVRINDRGPFVANRIVDLSYSAALRLDMVRTGTAFVTLEVLSPGSPVVASDSSTVLSPALPQGMTPDGATDAAAAPDAPAPAALPAPAPPAAAPAQRLFVQVGAYGDAANAGRVMQRLRAAQIDGVSASPTTSNGHTLQRVRVGPVATVDAFDRLVARLAALGYNNARLAQENE